MKTINYRKKRNAKNGHKDGESRMKPISKICIQILWFFIPLERGEVKLACGIFVVAVAQFGDSGWLREDEVAIGGSTGHSMNNFDIKCSMSVVLPKYSVDNIV